MAAVSLPTVGQLVKDRLPFLYTVTDADAVIARYLLITQYEVRGQIPALAAADDDTVQDIESYTPEQHIFLAAYVAYKMFKQKVFLAAAGGGSGDTPAEAQGNTVLKKAEVDVLNVEFDTLKIGDVALGMTTEKMFGLLAEETCTLARTIRITLAFCCNSVDSPTAPPIFIPSCNSCTGSPYC